MCVKKYGTAMRLFLNVSWLLLFALAGQTALHSETRYIRQGANGSGTSWADAYGSFAAAGLHDSATVAVRGHTYYVASGTYDSLTIRNAVRGTEWILIKKATEADHGDSTGWQGSYGNGQAILGSRLVFLTSYVEVAGNGVHTVPSDEPDDYGFKVAHDFSTSFHGVIAFGGHLATVSHVNLKYVHGYNTTNGDINNGTVMVRFYPTEEQSYIKLQNCFFENCGKDGLQISRSSYILVERCYVKRLGLLYSPPPLPDVHGQTVQLFYGGDDIIFRYNFWEANEGQSLIAIAGNGSRTDRVRFYGNLVFNKLSGTGATTAGFNRSGGIIGNAWPNYSGQDSIYIYNNTVVNAGGAYGGHAHFPMSYGTNQYGYNNLFYNCGGNTGASGFTAWDYHASGDCVYGGTNEQTGLSPSIFHHYAGNDFRLASETEPGLTLTSQTWWNASPSDFFAYLDSTEDVYGNTRGRDGNWDRGAFEFVQGGAFLQVTSPNGGEEWRQGQQRDITWTAQGISEPLTIEVLQGETVLGTVAEGISAASGSFAWTVGRLSNGQFVTGSNLKIRIRTTTGSVLANAYLR